MINETKKLIESVETASSSVAYQKWNKCDVVKKSDFDRVVEELTKWTKVEDELPKEDGQVLIRRKNGDWDSAYFFNRLFCLVNECAENPVIEWRYIN